MVKRAVHFDERELASNVGQVLARRGPLGIEHAFPIVLGPTATTDLDRVHFLFPPVAAGLETMLRRGMIEGRGNLA